MALINFARREIDVKIVFYGPAFSGKTTNVEVLHRLMPPTQRGELHSLRTEQDRTLFFDYVPVRLGEIAGFTARFKLFTVPGQLIYKETRRVLLQGADAVVFVADSTPDRAQANVDALLDLETNLAAHGLDLHSIPLVLQLNKRDVEGARSLEAMAELNPFAVPVVEAVAAEGRGVLDTLRRVTDIASHRIRENLAGHATAVALNAVERPEAEDDRAVVREQLEHIRRVRPRENADFEALKREGRIEASDVDAALSDLVVRSEDLTPPEGIPPLDGPLDELPVPRADRPIPDAPHARWSGGSADPEDGEATPVRPLHDEDPPTPLRAPLPATPAGRSRRWIAFGAVAVLAIALGSALGIGIGWMAFSAR